MQSPYSALQLHPAKRKSVTIQLTCISVDCASQIYRYYWFIDALQFVLLIFAAGVHSLNQFRKYRVAIIGLFTVATLLYIESTDAFLAGKETAGYTINEQEDRALTKVAGLIMTSAANFFFILVAGLEDEDAKLL